MTETAYLTQDSAAFNDIGLEPEPEQPRHIRARRRVRRVLVPPTDGGKSLPYASLRFRLYEKVMEWYLRHFGDGVEDERPDVEIHLTEDAERVLTHHGEIYGKHYNEKDIPVVVASTATEPARVIR